MNNTVAFTLLFFGVLLCGLAIFMPTGPTSSGWTDEQEMQYRKVSGEIHAHSHAGEQGEQDEAKLAAAREKYDKLNAELDNARNFWRRLKTIAQWTGIVLAAGGVMIYFAIKQ